MRGRLSGVVLSLALMAAPRPVVAGLDSPHDKEDATTTACYHCHTLTIPSGSGAYDFSPQCTACHNRDGKNFDLPWAASDEAVPGVRGFGHSYSGLAVSPAHGAGTQYLSTEILSKLADGRLQCAVCHDPHRSTAAVDTASMHLSIKPGEAKTGTFNALTTGTGTLTVSAAAGTGARGFRLRVRSVGGGGGTFVVSHDFGWNPDSWLNWNGSAWVAGTETGPGRSFSNGTAVALDVPGVSATWSAGSLEGDYWDFYIGYPMLRMTNVQDGGCVACHRERMMNHFRARGDDRYYRPNGVRKFSHPVGDGLNANGKGSDRATILDVDGTVGSSGTDGPGGTTGNTSNDLVLKGGVVRCTTCHAVHNADSNSLSVDAR